MKHASVTGKEAVIRSSSILTLSRVLSGSYGIVHSESYGSVEAADTSKSFGGTAPESYDGKILSPTG